MVHRIVSRVGSAEALDFWADRLAGEGIDSHRDDDRLRFADPEGLGHELRRRLRATSRCRPSIPRSRREHALGGVIGVRAHSLRPRGERPAARGRARAPRPDGGAWELRGEERAATITFDAGVRHRGIPGAGTVHHVAWGTTAAEHPHWLEQLAERSASARRP